MSETVGVVGLGLLGSAIAFRLGESGYDVCGYDPEPPASISARVIGSAGEVFAECSTVILSLPTSEIAAEVVKEVNDQLRAGQVIIDTTTGAPDEMIAISRELANQGVHYVEANVAGSSQLLRNGEATLFVAGDEAVVKELDSFFAALSGTVLFLGSVGNASRFKLVHNLILGLHRAVLAEGLEFGEALGFEAAQTLAILRQTPAASGVMETKGRRMANRQYDEPEARLSQHLKDVRLILAEADQKGVNLPLSTIHRDLLERVEKLGLGDCDNSAIREAFDRGEK